MPKRGGSRGKKKQRLRDLSRIPLTREEAIKQFGELSKDREPIVTALLGQVLLENELDDLLRGRFSRKDNDTWKSLTEDRAPLGTFHNKIITAHAFGIIDDTIKNATNTVRNIRNAFAHSKIQIDFSHPLIIEEIQKIDLPKKQRSVLFRELSAARALAAQPSPGPQFAYAILCLIIGKQLGKKRLARNQAKYRRLSKKHRKTLAANMMGQQIGPTSNFLRALLGNQNDDPKFLDLLSSPPKPRQ